MKSQFNYVFFREFNAAQTNNSLKVKDEMLEHIIKLADHQNLSSSTKPEILEIACECLKCLLKWPSGK